MTVPPPPGDWPDAPLPAAATATTTADGDALIAAHQAIEAAGELLRFHREGPATGWGAFGEMQVCEKLAEALSVACTIRLDRDELDVIDGDDERKALTDLRAICRDYIAGWAG